jgi:acetoin utilization deacetylase AcuC-like enzyme
VATALIDDPRFLKHDTGYHPETYRRLEVIRAALEGDDVLWGRLRHVEPVSASEEDITRCHSTELFDFIRRASSEGHDRVDPDTTISAESFDVARLAAGAGLRAVDLVVDGGADNAFAPVRPPGHHARPNAAMGFCLFNNAAIAARYAQARYGLERILIADWDVHHGNGSQEIFYTDPDVFYFSTHQFPYYPGTGRATDAGDGAGEGATLNVPLRSNTAAAVHREAFSEALRHIEERFHPDLIIVSAGFDSRIGDPLGQLMLNDSDFSEMTKELMGMAERHCSGRLIALLEGGYNLDNLGGAVHAHVQALTGKGTDI